MRLKLTYNFLGSGRLFRYRGIFSGLSNETMGTASYPACQWQQGFAPISSFLSLHFKFRPMSHVSLINLSFTIDRYDESLKRYARRIVKNDAVAADLVKEVFVIYCQRGNKIPVLKVRDTLKKYTRTFCKKWLRLNHKNIVTLF